MIAVNWKDSDHVITSEESGKVKIWDINSLTYEKLSGF